MITKTYEPLRPIYAPGDHEAFYYVALGLPRVFYGDSHWPSKSYWIVPYRDNENDD